MSILFLLFFTSQRHLRHNNANVYCIMLSTGRHWKYTPSGFFEQQPYLYSCKWGLSCFWGQLYDAYSIITQVIPTCHSETLSSSIVMEQFDLSHPYPPFPLRRIPARFYCGNCCCCYFSRQWQMLSKIIWSLVLTVPVSFPSVVHCVWIQHVALQKISFWTKKCSKRRYTTQFFSF